MRPVVSTRSPPGRRFLALLFPLLSIERLGKGQTSPDRPDAPFALIEAMRGALRLSAVDAAAAALGLGPGLALADARARVPELVVAHHDRKADARRLDALARAASRFTPLVALAPPDALILDITGTAHLFGGEHALARRLAARAARAGLTCRTGLGPSAAAARALARFGWAAADERAAILALPTAALEREPQAMRALTRAGLASVGDVARLPRTALARRLGPEAVLALDRLLGEAPEPLAPWHEARPFAVSERLAEPVLTVDGALAVLRRLMCLAQRRLERGHAGARRFTAMFERCDGARHALLVETSRPERDPRRLADLFAERLNNLADPLDPGFGYDRIALKLERLEALPPEALALLPSSGPVDREGLDALVDRLRILAGRDRLRRLCGADSHLPERANRWAPYDAAPAEPEGALAMNQGPEPVARPLFLLDPPEPIDAVAEVPDGPPRRILWRGQSCRITAFEGPERLEPEWWRRPHGRPAAAARDYYRLEDESGRRLWVCRAGAYGAQAQPRWYVHGLFA